MSQSADPPQEHFPFLRRPQLKARSGWRSCRSVSSSTAKRSSRALSRRVAPARAGVCARVRGQSSKQESEVQGFDSVRFLILPSRTSSISGCRSPCREIVRKVSWRTHIKTKKKNYKKNYELAQKIRRSWRDMKARQAQRCPSGHPRPAGQPAIHSQGISQCIISQYRSFQYIISYYSIVQYVRSQCSRLHYSITGQPAGRSPG